MYRWFLIFALLNFANSADLVSGTSCRRCGSGYCRPNKARHYGPPHNYYHGNSQTETGTQGQHTVQSLLPTNTFEDLAQNLAAAESAVRKYCGNNSNEIVNEVFALESYRLTYTLHDFKKDDINVKIRHGVINVTAKQVGLKSFNDLRILPSIVNTRLASWALQNNVLKIVIPYNVAFRREVVNECGKVNDAIIEVPPMKLNNFFHYRTNEKEKTTMEKKVQETTTTAQPEISNNKESDKISVDDAAAIVFRYDD